MKHFFASALVLASLGCGASAVDAGVVDLHVDVPYAIHARRTPLANVQASPARLARGGVAVILAPLFVLNAHAMTPAEARAQYEATFETFRAAHGALAPTEAWLSFEGADGFADDPNAIDAWMARGACLVGLVHARGNALGGASQDPSATERARGLTEAGKTLAKHVVARGGLLDLAHASDPAMDDLAAIARDANAPLVDSHTGLRALRDVARNLDDAHLRVVASSGGIVGISMHGGHVGKIPGQPPTLGDYVDALLHAVAVAGIDHVAIGSDFDGGIDPPRGVDGESVWPRVRAMLVHRGVSNDDVTENIFHERAPRL